MGRGQIELPESWAGLAEPLRALMVEVEREALADRTMRSWLQPRGSLG